ncbi:TPA: DnaB-like helicase C-terminal domain-containing protein [Escherichia coli]
MKIGVNKVVSQWISQDSLTLAKTANKTLAESANGYKPSQLNTKDNIQKTINTNTPLWVVDASRLSVEEIRSIAERHKQENPNLSLIMADYLGLIEKPKADRNDLAIAHISGSLKAMAKDLKTPVISLSQLSRDVEKRPNKRPTNADLRDSGSIEQDADSIIMLYREAVYDENSSAAPFAEIIVTKNRFGSLGTVYQRFCNGHFVACDQDEARQICTASNAPAARGRRYAQGADV